VSNLMYDWNDDGKAVDTKKEWGVTGCHGGVRTLHEKEDQAKLLAQVSEE